MKHLVFDFDGTLANSMPVIIDIAEGMLDITITPEDVKRYRNLTAKQVLKEARIPLYRVPSLLVRGKTLMSARVGQVKIFTGLESVIKELADDHVLYVVSSNGIGIIDSFLKRYEIDQYFTNVYGNVGLFSKAQAIRKVMKRERFSTNNSIYIGDEVRDIEAAKKVGIPIVSVTWGYNGKELLSSYSPDYIVDTPKQLKKVIVANKA